MKYLDELDLPDLESVPVEIVYLRNLYCVLPAVNINSKYIDSENENLKDLKDIIRPMLETAMGFVANYTNVKRGKNNGVKLSGTREEELLDVIKSEINNPDTMSNNPSIIAEAVFDLKVKLEELKKGLKEPKEIEDMPKAQLRWHAKNKTTHAPDSQICVKEKFDKLFVKYKNKKLPLQLAEHKRSEEKDQNKHDGDKLILAQTIYKRSVDYPNCKIYIASNDMRFFSPFIKRDTIGKIKDKDRTLTQYILDEFKITCDIPEKILKDIEKNSNDNA